MEKEENKQESKRAWLKWAGIGAFTFFLIKGLLWLAIPALLWIKFH